MQTAQEARVRSWSAAPRAGRVGKHFLELSLGHAVHERRPSILVFSRLVRLALFLCVTVLSVALLIVTQAVGSTTPAESEVLKYPWSWYRFFCCRVHNEVSLDAATGSLFITSFGGDSGFDCGVSCFELSDEDQVSVIVLLASLRPRVPERCAQTSSGSARHANSSLRPQGECECRVQLLFLAPVSVSGFDYLVSARRF